MSLTDSPDFSFRAEDKAAHMLYPCAEDYISNSFDEFFDKELYGLSNQDDDKEPSSTDDLATIHWDQPPGPMTHSIVRGNSPAQPWRKGLWCLNSKPTAKLVVGKTRRNDRAAQAFVPPSHLTGSENFIARSPASPTKITKNMYPNLKPVTVDNVQSFQRTNIRDQVHSPMPAYDRFISPGKMERGRILQQNFENFHLQMPDNGIYLSSQYSGRPVQGQAALRNTNERIVARNATVAHLPQSPTKYHERFNQRAKQKIEYTQDTNIQNLTPGLTKIKMEHLDHAAYLNEDDGEYAGPVWTTESLHSSDSSYQSQTSQYSNDSHPNAYAGISAADWGLAPQSRSFHLTTDDDHSKIATPIPQRNHHIIHQQDEQYNNVLGIDHADMDEIGKAISYEPAQIYKTEFRTTTPPYTTAIPADPYPPLPPYPPEDYIEASLFTTPRRRGTSYSRSPSPTASPTRRSASRSQTQRSPTRSSEHLHTRRKSLHKPGPIKDTSHHEAHRRTRSASRAPRTPKTPTSAGFAQLDFVNFTLKDSAKLMSDVAPSGSSKTRARREQEARDKRKKLSEAALQAVRDAGGDVTALHDAIFV